MRLFSPTSFWNTPLAPDAPLDPTSATLIADLMTVVTAQENARTGPWLDSTTISVVPANQPTVPVSLSGGTTNAALTAAWANVPMPLTSSPGDVDGDLAIYQPSTDKMWEFFQLKCSNGLWAAEWGGAMQNVSANPGVYGPDAWPGAATYWGVTACSFPIAGGVITFDDLARGSIDHAICMTVPHARKGCFAPPAERCDGNSTDPNALPEGAHLRLDPTLNLDSIAMPRLTRMISEAAQRYGIYVRDQSDTLTAFFLQDPTGNGWAEDLANRYYGPEAAFQLLYYLPWAHLQVLELNLQPMP